jgi:hypothetical protein
MDIWVDRGIYDSEMIQSIKASFQGSSYGSMKVSMDPFSRVSNLPPPPIESRQVRPTIRQIC